MKKRKKKNNYGKKDITINIDSLEVGDIITYWNNGYRTGVIDEINTKKQILFLKISKFIEKYSEKGQKRTKVKFCDILKKEEK